VEPSNKISKFKNEHDAEIAIRAIQIEYPNNCKFTLKRQSKESTQKNRQADHVTHVT
jgi:hypothetical protein